MKQKKKKREKIGNKHILSSPLRILILYLHSYNIDRIVIFCIAFFFFEWQDKFPEKLDWEVSGGNNENEAGKFYPWAANAPTRNIFEHSQPPPDSLQFWLLVLYDLEKLAAEY